jgi:hypothetical protein
MNGEAIMSMTLWKNIKIEQRQMQLFGATTNCRGEWWNFD